MAEQKTILVVDDDRFNVTLMRELCQSGGYLVIEAYNGQQALELARSHLPDLVLLDLMMAGTSGFEVCQQLRADPATKDMAIIMVTALDDIESKMRGLELGADDYITKPFRLFELQQRVRSVLAARYYRRQLEQARRQLQRLGDFDTPGRVGGFRQLRNGLEYEFRRAQRYEHPLAAVLLSPEGYDRVLESQGKRPAAAIIGAVVTVLRRTLRAVDRIYRIDKDQFLVLLPETDSAGARRAMERVREQLLDAVPPQPGPISITAWLVCYPAPGVQVANDMLHLLGNRGGQHSSGGKEWFTELTGA